MHSNKASPPTLSVNIKDKNRFRRLARTSDNTDPFSNSSLRHEKSTPSRGAFRGAEKRIRTSGKLQTYTRFPIVLLKPLRHLCINRRSFSKRLFILLYFFKNCKRFYPTFEKFPKILSVPLFNYFSKLSSTISASTAFTETLLIPFITPLLDLYPSSLIAILSPFVAISL